MCLHETVVRGMADMPPRLPPSMPLLPTTLPPSLLSLSLLHTPPVPLLPTTLCVPHIKQHLLYHCSMDVFVWFLTVTRALLGDIFCENGKAKQEQENTTHALPMAWASGKQPADRSSLPAVFSYYASLSYPCSVHRFGV